MKNDGRCPKCQSLEVEVVGDYNESVICQDCDHVWDNECEDFDPMDFANNEVDDMRINEAIRNSII